MLPRRFYEHDSLGRQMCEVPTPYFPRASVEEWRYEEHNPELDWLDFMMFPAHVLRF